MTRRSYPENEYQDQRAKADHQKWLPEQKLGSEKQLEPRLRSNPDASVVHAAMIGAVGAVSLVFLYLSLLWVTH
jgi:hypothetical protein